MVSFQQFFSSPLDHGSLLCLPAPSLSPTHSLHSRPHSYFRILYHYLQTCTHTKPSLSSCLLFPPQHPPFLLLSCMPFAFHPRATLSDECYHPRSDNQQQARAAIEEPAPGGSSFLPGVLKNVGISAGLGVLGDVGKHFGHHNHTRREPTPLHFPHLLPAIDRREPMPFHFKDLLPIGIDRREPLSERSLGTTALGLVGSQIGSEVASHVLNHKKHTR